MQLYSIETGNFKLDGGAMFGVVPKSIWSKTNSPDSNNLCNWAMRCLLIEDGDKLILVDNGIGNKQDAKFFSHYFLNGNQSLDTSLASSGFHRSDITDVFLTHLHFDHCGGSIERHGDRLLPAFPKATYWSNERHWQWAVSPNDREKASFLKMNILPIMESGQLKMIDIAQTSAKNRVITSDQFTLPHVLSGILPELSLRLVNGHTDSMMLPQITYKNQTIVFLADLLPSAGHLPLPYVMAYDMFPLTTLAEKKSFLAEACQNNYVLFFEHDDKNECCRLTATEKGIKASEFFHLSEV